MSKVVMVLAMVLVHLQPLTGALLCPQQIPCQVTASHTTSSHHHSHTTPHGTTTPIPCAAMSLCAPVVTALLPALEQGTPVLLPVQAPVRLSTLRPTTVFTAPPFHPPSV